LSLGPQTTTQIVILQFFNQNGDLFKESLNKGHYEFQTYVFDTISTFNSSRIWTTFFTYTSFTRARFLGLVQFGSDRYAKISYVNRKFSKLFQSALTLINKPGYPLTHGSVCSLLCERVTVPENGYKTTHNNFIHTINQVQNRLTVVPCRDCNPVLSGGEDCRAIASANSAGISLLTCEECWFVFVLLEDAAALFSLLVVLQIVLLATQGNNNTGTGPF